MHRCGTGQETRKARFEYGDYHDTDWGVPEYGQRALGKKLLSRDGFQAGLS